MFRQAAGRIHDAGPDALVRLLAELQRSCPSSSGAVAEIVLHLAGWETPFLAEASRVVDPRDLVREVKP